METTHPQTRGIAQISLERIGRFETFALELRDGQIVELQGDNDQGKTTIIRAIETLITGQISEKTRETAGADSGVIEARIGPYALRRVIRDGKTVGFEVRDASGKKQAQAQTLLNTLFKGTFLNPFEIAALSPRERARVIAQAIDLDPEEAREALARITGEPEQPALTREEVLPAIARMKQQFYDRRHDLNVALKQDEAAARSAREQLPADWSPETPAPQEPAGMGDLYARQAAMKDRNRRRADLDSSIAQDEHEIAFLREQLATLEQRVRATTADREAMGPPEDLRPITQQLETHEQAMAAYREEMRQYGKWLVIAKQAEALEVRAFDGRCQHETLDAQVRALDALPAQLLASAEVPVPGMAITEDGVALPDAQGTLLPLEAFGEATVLEFCVKLAMALAPAPFVLIDGMERCGPARSAALYDYIRECGYQCLSSRTTEGELQPVTI